MFFLPTRVTFERHRGIRYCFVPDIPIFYHYVTFVNWNLEIFVRARVNRYHSTRSISIYSTLARVTDSLRIYFFFFSPVATMLLRIRFRAVSRCLRIDRRWDAETRRFPQNMLGTEKAKAFPLAARVPFCVPRSGCLPSKNLAGRNSAKYAGFPF